MLANRIVVLLCLPFAACADRGRAPVPADAPAAPIGEPRIFVPEVSDADTSAGGRLPSSSSESRGAHPSGDVRGNSGGGGGQSGSPVPEPGTLLLLGSALTGLGCFSHRRRRRERAAQTASESDHRTERP